MDEHRKMEINSDTTRWRRRRPARTPPTTIRTPPPHDKGRNSERRTMFNSTGTEVNAGMKFRRGSAGGRREEGGLAHNYLRRQCT